MSAQQERNKYVTQVIANLNHIEYNEFMACEWKGYKKSKKARKHFMPYEVWHLNWHETYMIGKTIEKQLKPQKWIR